MNKNLIKSVLFLGTFLLSGTASAEMTLQSALERTFQENPTIKAQEHYVNSVKAEMDKAKSGFKPTVVGTGSYGNVHTHSRTNPIHSNNHSKPVNYGVSLKQPIFSGLSTYNELKKSKAEYSSAEAALNQVRQDVLLKAVVAYTDVLDAQAVLDLNINNEKVLKRQRDYTSDRFQVGELTRTDDAQANARYAGAQSDLIKAEGDMKVALAAFEEIVGVHLEDPRELVEPVIAILTETLPDQLKVAFSDVNKAVDIALKFNPNILVAEENLKAAKANVSVAKAGYSPMLDLEAGYNVYRAGPHGSSGYDSNYKSIGDLGRERGEEGSVRLVLTVPFYQAGTVSATVKQTLGIKEKSEQNLIDVKRNVQRNVTEAWQKYHSVQDSLIALQEQVKANEIAVEGVKSEEQSGARTTLDVLNAEQELKAAKVSLVNAQKNMIDCTYNLLAQMGAMTPSLLNLFETPVEVVPSQKEMVKEKIENIDENSLPVQQKLTNDAQ